MKSFGIEAIKKHPSLIPLIAVVGAGVTAAILYPLRCAVKSPEATWNRVKNPEPWNEYKDKQYKFYQSDSVPKKAVIPEY